MHNLVFILIGGSAGVISRYFISNYFNSISTHSFRFGTITVNLIGSFAIGAIWAFMENRSIDPKVKNMITTGFLGCFTTFSTFSLETLQYLNGGDYSKAIANILISNILGVALVFAGYFLVKSTINN